MSYPVDRFQPKSRALAFKALLLAGQVPPRSRVSNVWLSKCLAALRALFGRRAAGGV